MKTSIGLSIGLCPLSYAGTALASEGVKVNLNNNRFATNNRVQFTTFFVF